MVPHAERIFRKIDAGHRSRYQFRILSFLQVINVEVIQVLRVNTFYLVAKDVAKPSDGIWKTQR
jgi:hypothetical protein